MNEESRKVIQIHDSYESLHKMVPKEVLPSEYGGLAGPWDNTECAEAVYKLNQYFSNVEEIVDSNEI